MERSPCWLKNTLMLMVASLIQVRASGDVGEFRQLKRSIDNMIKAHRLDPMEVYFMFGDPDDPQQRPHIWENVKKFIEEAERCA